MDAPAATSQTALPAGVREVLKRYWGFDALRPLQAEAINAALAGRDLLTVLPTGGGKSLCYQVPPLVTGRVTLVVSPLIALMQDQVAALRLAGVSAGAVHSNLTEREAAEVREQVMTGELRLLFVAPERLLLPNFLAFARRLGVGAIAIDEAHCISQWGHDFRPEYRRLAELRDALPEVPLGAFTATATPRVREDIVRQLKLREPVELVGTFDRPNLTYRILPRLDVVAQTVEAVGRHTGQASIVYCITRKETEHLAAALRQKGIDAAAYHAGMDAAERTRVSRAFRDEKLSVVVATVAFGMGIDRGDVRCVVHAAMPKTIEAYQQETGRAGRDGLPAECVMLYSAADVMLWKRLMERGGDQGASPEVLTAQLEMLNEMQRMAAGARCRHRALSEYFGQEYPAPNCGGCDVCLNELQPAADAHETARKIISCVARCGQAFGAGYVADVLVGAGIAKVRERGHDQISTFGLLRNLSREQVVGYINQLIDSGDLMRTEGEYPVVQLTEQSAAVLRNEKEAALLEPKAITGRTRREKAGASGGEPLSPEEQGLFDALRALRRSLAEARGVPPFVICSDAVLEEICRVRPGSVETLVNVRGIGSRKAEEFGEDIVRCVRGHCALHGLVIDARAGTRPRRAPREERAGRTPAGSASAATEMFRRGMSVDDVSAAVQRSRSTVVGYLCEFIERERPASVGAWVDASTYRRVAEAARDSGSGRLKPVFDKLEGEVAYDQIRLVMTHLSAQDAGGVDAPAQSE